MSTRTPEQLRTIAEEAYLFCFPLILMETTRKTACNFPAGTRPGFGPANQFAHLRAFPPGDFREVVRPNFDTLYSLLWFDLVEEPIILSAPDTGGRYYMLPMLDMWTDVFAVVGSRTTGSVAGRFALVGPGWKGDLPEGVERIDVPTPNGWVLGRTQANGTADYAAVHRIQDGFNATPLSRFPGEYTPEDHIDPSVDVKTPPLDQVLAMDARQYFTTAAELMMIYRPHLVDQPVLARMTSLGLRPGRPFAPEGEQLAAVQDVPAQAQRLMRDLEPKLSPVVNGWGMMTTGIGVYGTDYLRRAVIAKIGLGANLPEDALYPVLYLDENGEPPVGERSYVLHFDAGALPPVDAFWSVTMYDGEGFPVPNSLDRYALGDRDPLTYNADGSLDLWIQRDDPGSEKTLNWLPAPAGKLGITLRMYAPKAEIARGLWSPPPLRRVS